MIKIPKKTEERLKVVGRKFQKPTKEAADRDINESDTVTLITDMLAEVFGWDKYVDLTSEHAIRGAFCDIAIKSQPEDKTPWIIIEAKAIGINLNDSHLRQAVHYGADAGVEWVVLTTAMTWKVYKVSFTKPVNYELFAEFNFLDLNFRSQNDLEKLFVLTKEGAKKNAIDLLYKENQLTNRFALSALLQGEPVLKLLQKEIRKINKNVKVEKDDIQATLVNDVLKREVTEGDKFEAARKLIRKSLR